ncbi:protein-disulfide reductase DsbD domain-containing protein [Notoacmeibacter ruber]|nr:protein-disulfide reductase DsbD domain-containing protein [Notoacmeibacter ruber]
MQRLVAVLVLCLLASAFSPTSAPAGAGQWTSFEGGRARLLASGGSGDDYARAWVEIELQEGWKTYWLQPGDSGVAPSVTLRMAGHEIRPTLVMPAPQRFREPHNVWAGYKDRTYIAMDVPTPDAAGSLRLEASVFLGICQQICIPLTLQLAAPLEAEDNKFREAETLEAMSPLPETLEAAGLTPEIETADDRLIITFQSESLEDARDAELFIAEGPSGLRLAAPDPASDNGDGTLRFEMPILKEKDDMSGKELCLLLVIGKRGYVGSVDLPSM